MPGGIDPAVGWLVLALVLGGAELLAPGVFLIFLAIAAAATGAICWAMPDVPLIAQLGSFGVWSAVTVAIGRRWYRDFPTDTDDALLNDRAARLLGTVVTVAEPIVHGRGRVTLGDSVWLARGPESEAGARVRVTAVDGAVLVVEPADQPSPAFAGEGQPPEAAG